MENKNLGTLEVSASTWFDEEEEAWLYSVFIIHNETEEELDSWGSSDTKAEAVQAISREIGNYLSI